MPSTENKRGIFALMVAHCAGMLDLVALPVWVGTLIVQFRFDPQQAGGLATLFLIGASLASLVFAPRFTRHDPKRLAVSGFAIASLAFVLATQNASFEVLALLHCVGGLAAGAALSFTHGTIGHARNPHRLFALVGMAIGAFGIVFLGGTPVIVAKFGGPALFLVFAGVMASAALVGVFFFPRTKRHIPSDDPEHPGLHLPRLPRAVWYSVVAVALLAMTQAMTLSFFESIGLARGFGRDNVTLALVIYGVVTLFPAPLAALLEKRLAATTVISIVPVFQAVFAMLVTHTSSYTWYAVGGSLMAFTILFTHTFAFGLLARLDPSGRAVAGTPAMLMVGAAVAPFIGGTLVKFIGFEAIGYAACVLVAIELLMFNLTRRAVLSQGTLVLDGAPLPVAVN
jgi:predicted MFS family arabinose efflux permease